MPDDDLFDDDELLFASEDDDDVVFAAEGEDLVAPASNGNGSSWKLLVVDDEAAVHDVTRLALAAFSFEGRARRVRSAE